jgi:hypothetical protein
MKRMVRASSFSYFEQSCFTILQRAFLSFTELSGRGETEPVVRSKVVRAQAGLVKLGL